MSEIEKVDNVEPEDKDHVSQQEPETTSNDVVKYESYRKVVGQNKKFKSELEKLQEQLSQIQNEKLTAEGKKDELIQSLQEQANEYKSKYAKAIGSFAKTKAYDVITDEAVKMGCQSVSLLKRAVEDRLDSLDYDDSFTPDRDQVKAIILEIKEQEPVLFSKAGANIANHNINPSPTKQIKAKKLSEMTEEELLQHWKKQL